MKDVVLLTIHLISLLIRLLQPGGIKTVAAENLLLKQQLLIIGRSRGKAPNLKTADRFIPGWLAMLLSPNRMARSAIIIQPSTLLKFHKALVRRKYLRQCHPIGKANLDPKGLIAIVAKPLWKLKEGSLAMVVRVSL